MNDGIFKRFFFRVIAFAFGFFLAFGLAELGIRLISPQMTGPVQYAYHPQLGPIPVPNQHARRTLPGVYDYTYSNNSYGWRGPKEYSQVKTTEYRILFLGDSFTYGIGVNDDQTFVYQVEQSLSTNWSIEVINAGNGGKGTDYALKFFSSLGSQFKPDLTVLCFSPNDFSDNSRGQYYVVSEDDKLIAKSLSTGITAKKDFLRMIPLYDWLISWSHAANLLKQTIIRLIIKSGSATKDTAQSTTETNGDTKQVSFHRQVIYYPSEADYANDQNRWLAGIYLKHLKEAVEEAGSDFLIFYIPITADLTNYRETRQISKTERAAFDLFQSQNLDALSVTPVLANSKEPVFTLYYTEGHWTPVATSLAARFMSEQIQKRLEEKSLPR